MEPLRLGLYKLLRRKYGWFQPIAYQWHIFLAYIIMIGWSSILQNPFYRLFIIFLHAYLAASLVHWLHNRWVKVLVYIAMFALFIINASLEVNFGLHISPSMLNLLAETSRKEATEFIHTLWSIPTIWVVPTLVILFILFLFLSERKRITVAERILCSKAYIYIQMVSAVMLAVGTVSSWCYITLFQCKTPDEVSEWNSHMRYPSDALTRAIIAFHDIRLASKEMEKAILIAENVEPFTYDTGISDSLSVVLVIGESYIKSHASLYGYPLKTTPFMDKEQDEGRLFAFTDVVSPYNLTTNAMRNLISCNSMADDENWSDMPPLTAVFKKAGYKVSMFDNQKTFSLAATFTFALNTYLYSPRISKVCYDELNSKTYDYDEQLVRECHPSHSSPRHLVVFHLMGQHIQFNQRYPEHDHRFSVFSADSIKRREKWLNYGKKKLIAQYDNATYYNDYVLSVIARKYKDKNAIMVYLADHGEEVYDYRNSSGRFGSDDLKNVLRFQYEVPFVVWCSDIYKQSHPHEIDLLKQALDRPFMTDNTCQLLLYIGGLSGSAYYKDNRNIISPQYQKGKRILNDCYDYDLILEKHKEANRE